MVVFLIDGLPYATLQTQLERKNLPNIQSFFINPNNQLFKARTAFPALTFPSITSLLEAAPVDSSGIYGNQILYGNSTYQLEDPANFAEFNKMIKDRSVFARFDQQGLKTVSASYGFTSDSLSHLQLNDVEAALAIKQKNYKLVDNKIINSLDKLLVETPEEKWPDFIFVHLIGIDFTSHDLGANSVQVISYLQYLDSKLAPIFHHLNQARGRKVVSMLTSDHGFDRNHEKALNLEQVLQKVDPQIQVLNEGRYLSLFFPPGWSLAKRKSVVNDIGLHAAVDIAALRFEDTVYMHSKKLKLNFSYSEGRCSLSDYKLNINDNSSCPETMDVQIQKSYYPYFVENISHFFKVSGHPDAVIIAKSGVAFRNDYAAYHGGPTPAETIVPLLMHNCNIVPQSRIPSLAELLRFL